MLAEKNHNIFAMNDLELVRTNIEAISNQAAYAKAYPTLLKHRCIIEYVSRDTLEARVTERAPLSKGSSPIVIINKRDGTHRICYSFRALNKTTTPVTYQMPTIEEIMSVLDNTKCLTTLGTNLV